MPGPGHQLRPCYVCQPHPRSWVRGAPKSRHLPRNRVPCRNALSSGAPKVATPAPATRAGPAQAILESGRLPKAFSGLVDSCCICVAAPPGPRNRPRLFQRSERLFAPETVAMAAPAGPARQPDCARPGLQNSLGNSAALFRLLPRQSSMYRADDLAMAAITTVRLPAGGGSEPKPPELEE